MANQIRGIPEVPMGMNGFTRRQMVDARQVTLALRGAQATPPAPTNFKVTPEAFGNLLQWTRATGSDFTEVFWNTTPNLTTANLVQVGNVAQWVDNVGQSGVLRWYWVRAGKNNGARSLESPAISGTTLASGTGVNPPTPPPAGQQQRIDQRTGRRYPY
jgi:hypothetical protein